MADSDEGYSSPSDAEPSPVQPPSSASTSANPPRGKGTTNPQQGKKEEGKDTDNVKRRSSKACDNCRRAKCKCVRVLDPATNEAVGPCQNCLQVGTECKFEGATRKRGPPKGYIEAIESRLHRMEALLGNLLASDDPRAQTLLGELIGDRDARDVLAKDLRAAADATATGKAPKRSWKREYAESQEQLARMRQQEEQRQRQQQQKLPPPPPVVSVGFDGSTTTLPSSSAPDGRVHPAAPTWLSQDDLMGGVGSSSNALGFDPALLSSSFPSSTSARPDIHIGPSSSQSSSSFIPGLPPLPPLPSSSSASHNAFEVSTSPRQRRRLDLPLTAPSGVVPIAPAPPPPAAPSPSSSNTPAGIIAAGSPNAGFPTSFGSASASAPSPSSGLGSSLAGVGAAGENRKQMAYAFKLPERGVVPSRSAAAATAQPVPARESIGHTGSAQYSLSSPGGGRGGGGGMGKMGGGGGGKEKEEPLSELADVVGQLSLNENSEVRYHGRSSGLYLIARSQRFRDFFWNFPSAGVWPHDDKRVQKTEYEILGTSTPLPDSATQAHLLNAYWAYVHPHFPILYKITFLRQYRHMLAQPESREPSTPAGGGKVPLVLLLSMFALAARYCDLEREDGRGDGKQWSAGQEYLDKARTLLNHDYGSSKLVTVQALLLISYREIGIGAMSAAWMSTGMAIRMAQDLGLHRDVSRWKLPVEKFGYEEQQLRKRIWWGCLAMDRYTSSYIGRPGAIHERDYDCSFPSENEPDEHEQWRPIRVDGTEWSEPPKSSTVDLPPKEVAEVLRRYPTGRAHTLSCFNAAGTLAVIINRIIIGIYAIRTRVLGQSSDTLLSLLDQALASWYLTLPAHLQYNPAGAKVPPPHILALHLQFYSALILLHRPFIPGQNSTAPLGAFPSHSICTTSATAIANIVSAWRKTFTLRQCPPFLTYPLFSASIIFVYNASFDEALARPAKNNLVQLLEALKEMEVQWGSAMRARELLHGLVDLRGDASLNPDSERGTKRSTMDVDETASSSASSQGSVNFHSRPPVPSASQPRPTGQRRRSSTAGSSKLRSGSTSRPPGGPPPAAASPSMIPEHAAFSPPPPPTSIPSLPSFSFPSPPAASAFPLTFPPPPPPTLPASNEVGSSAQTFDILGPNGGIEHFQSPPGVVGGANDFADFLNSFLSPTNLASGLPATTPSASFPLTTSTGTSVDMPGGTTTAPSAPQAAAPSIDPTAAFAGMPFGAGDDWFNYSYNAFSFGGSDAGGTPDSLVGMSGASPSTQPQPQP
ncbi:hypothetical protein JCM8547_005707 [Rhodosporidiobolus lusitaniae]